jgi:hypothetical protein
VRKNLWTCAVSLSLCVVGLSVGAAVRRAEQPKAQAAKPRPALLQSLEIHFTFNPKSCKLDSHGFCAVRTFDSPNAIVILGPTQIDQTGGGLTTGPSTVVVPGDIHTMINSTEFEIHDKSLLAKGTAASSFMGVAFYAK